MKNPEHIDPRPEFSKSERWCRWIAQIPVDAVIADDARDHILTWNLGLVPEEVRDTSFAPDNHIL
jgi:hypothetical protein